MAFRQRPRVTILGASGAAVSGAADTNENTLATITVPAGAMGPNGILRISATWSCTSSANNKQFRIRFSGASGTQYVGTTQTTITTFSVDFKIANRNSASSQVSVGGQPTASGLGTSSTAVVTSSVDTTAATTIVITGQKASAGETITLECYTVELLQL